MEGNAEMNIYIRGYTEGVVNAIYALIMQVIGATYVDKEEVLKILDSLRDRLREKIEIEKGK